MDCLSKSMFKVFERKFLRKIVHYRNWCNEIQLNLACAQKSRCSQTKPIQQKISFEKRQKKFEKIEKKEKKTAQIHSVFWLILACANE